MEFGDCHAKLCVELCQPLVDTAPENLPELEAGAKSA